MKHEAITTKPRTFYIPLERRRFLKAIAIASAGFTLPGFLAEAIGTTPLVTQGPYYPLADDIALALRYEPDGTPLVLVNGKKASAFAPFLYALVLTGGRADDAAFAALPPGNPNAHVH
jgi:hypothetical protein